MNTVYRLLFKFFLIFTFCEAGCNYSVSNMVASFDPEEINRDTNRKNDTIEYTITNSGNTPLALEIKVCKRSIDVDGVDKLEEDNSFHISQPQLIVDPSGTAKIAIRFRQVKYDKTAEQAFRVCFEQVPIDVVNDKAIEGEIKHSITINVNIMTSLYLTPKNTKPDVVICSVNGDIVILENVGTRRIAAKDISTPVTVNGKTYVFAKIVLKEDEEKVVLANSKRKLRVDKAKLIDSNTTTQKPAVKRLLPVSAEEPPIKRQRLEETLVTPIRQEHPAMPTKEMLPIRAEEIQTENELNLLIGESPATKEAPKKVKKDAWFFGG